MNTMKFTNSHSLFELVLSVESDNTMPPYADSQVAIKVQSDGFSGWTKAWVNGAEFADFRSALLSLEQSLNGEAKLESISPNELQIRIYPANRRGYLAIEGGAGHYIRQQERMFWHSVTFGFTFEPQQLSQVASVSWLNPR